MQAAFLRIKLKTLDEDNFKRRAIAKTYLEGISNSKIKLPSYSNLNDHVFYAFVVLVEDRASFTRFLDNHYIEWLIHYPIPPHKQKALVQYSNLHLPQTELLHKKIVSIPISPVMVEEEIQLVIDTLNAY